MFQHPRRLQIMTIALVLAMCADTVAADRIGVYQDSAATSCALNPSAFGLLAIYFVHHSEGARVAKFRVNNLLGLGAPIGTSVTAGFASMGTYADGIEVGYPTCRTGKTLIGTMAYFYQLQPMDCSDRVEIVAHPDAEIPGEVIAVDCNQPIGNVKSAFGGRGFGGPNSELCGGCFDIPLPSTQPSTWGSVKALYR